MQYKCLSIAGFDGSGGAGLQADLKTFSAFGCYGMTIVTAVAVQNTMGVKQCYSLPIECISQQLEAIFEDIEPDSIKIGMLFSQDIIEVVADFLAQHAFHIPIVLDPVMVAKHGEPLLLPEAMDALRQQLIPQATLLTPNLPEAWALTTKIDDANALAQELLKLGPKAVLLKGGHGEGDTSDDVYLDQTGQQQWFSSPRIISKNTHGTGCTLSAAIAANLALGKSLIEACQLAKHYLSQAIDAAKDISVGHGQGPVHHFYHLWPTIEIIENKKR